MLKWILSAMAGMGALSAILLAHEGLSSRPVPALSNPPAIIPFNRGIAGTGIVEPASETVTVGVSEPGLVQKVFVREGQSVLTGDPLFRIDSRSQEAELLTAQAAVLSAEADLERVMAPSRIEDQLSTRAKLSEAAAGILEATQNEVQCRAAVAERLWNLKDNQQRVERMESAVKVSAIPEEQIDRLRFAVKICEAQLDAAKSSVEIAQARTAMAKARAQQAQAELDKLLAGAWAPDIKKSRAALEEARSRAARLNLEIERRTVRAPLDANVIRLNLRAGEYAAAASVNPENAGIVLGDMKTKHVRVDVDEFDAPRLKTSRRAAAFLKGSKDCVIPLEFVRVEPYVVPKRALSNSQHELVDTRVLQVVYRITDPQNDLYAGQQVDVFIDADK
jgi:HlyD family secretion protein